MTFDNRHLSTAPPTLGTTAVTSSHRVQISVHLRFLVFLFSLHVTLYEIYHVMCIISYILGSESFACY